MTTTAESPDISAQVSPQKLSPNDVTPINGKHLPVDTAVDEQASESSGVEQSVGDQNMVAGILGETHVPDGAAIATADLSIHEGQVPASSLSESSPPVEKDQKKDDAAPAPAPPAVQIDDGEKPENGSLSTDNTQAHAPRKVNKSSGALTSSSTRAHSPTLNGNGKPKGSSARSSKPSFFSKLLRMFIPCVGPSHAHTVDIDKPALIPNESKDEKVVTAPVLEKEFPTAPPEVPPISPTDAATSTSTAPIPPPSLPDVPPPALNADVALPPTPTKVLLPTAETGGVTSGAVQPPGSTGEDSPRGLLQTQEHHRDLSHDPAGEESDGTSFTEDDDADDGNAVDEAEDDEERLITNGGAGIPIGPDGIPRPLLPPIAPQHAGRKCLVLDLDETLVHSSFKSISQADYVVPVEIEYHWHNVYVIKRPGVDNFLKKMGEIYEVVVFTASLSKYADPVLDKLDVHQVVTHRLFRESCYNHKGNYVKDLSQLGRPIADTIILDNSPASYIFHPNNAVPVSSWFNDPHDTELTDLVPFLADLSPVDDVRGVLDGGL